MNRTVYNKLIRDRIPEIIAQNGKSFESKRMSEEEYEQALIEKLLEEALEVQQADDFQLLSELADLQEVFETLLNLKGISRHSLRVEQNRRRKERGGFKKRLKLLWTF